MVPYNGVSSITNYVYKMKYILGNIDSKNIEGNQSSYTDEVPETSSNLFLLILNENFLQIMRCSITLEN